MEVSELLAGLPKSVPDTCGIVTVSGVLVVRVLDLANAPLPLLEAYLLYYLMDTEYYRNTGLFLGETADGYEYHPCVLVEHPGLALAMEMLAVPP